MFSKKVIPFLFIMIMPAFFTSCYYDKANQVYPINGCDTSNNTYSGAVAPILSANCQGCHNTNNAGGGVDLSTHAGVQEVALNGRLMGSITWTAGYSRMPQGGSQLSDCDITKINKWVIDSARNN